MDRIRRALWWLITAPFRLVFWLISLPFRFLGWLFRPVVQRFKGNPVYVFLTEEIEDRPATDAIADALQNPTDILSELDAVRKHLLRALLALVVTVGISFYFTQDLIAFLATPLKDGMSGLQAIEVTESIGVFMKVALIAGIALASPYIAFEVWLFAAPGLMPRSRQLSLLAIPLTLVFFLGGMAFAFFNMLPTALPFLLDFLGIATKLRPASYFGFVTSLMFWIGVAFEFPLVILALSMVGIVKYQMLIKQWRIAIILIAVLSAVITPTVDPVNMALVMGPMTALYFLSIFFSYLVHLANRKKE
jgi:sec-independent protein translocase protein TatC